MDKQLDLIKTLSLADNKTLSQKALKLAEECGELAKKVLPYESASGTLHRIVHKEQILEEAADSILVALSITYSLGYDDSDIASMIDNKSLYWMQIQKEQGSIDPNKLPHEIHLTIENVTDVDLFRAFCQNHNIKPIVLNLHTVNSSDVILEMMTSTIFIGSTTQALSLMESEAEILESGGYKVIRKKIETAPFHPAVPSNKNDILPSELTGQYFEIHLEVLIDENDKTRDLNALRKWIKNNDYELAISTNIFKSVENGIRKVILTYRTDGVNKESFDDIARLKRERLVKAGWNIVEKSLTEYSIYDTNRKHDSIWLEYQY